jgi:undecaprenyl-diphosphatase
MAMGGLDPWVAERVYTMSRGWGHGMLLTLSLGGGVAISSAAWFAARQGRRAYDRRYLAGSGLNKIVFAIASGLGAAALTWPIKLAIGRARPSTVGATEHLHFDLLALGADASLPSTQAAVAGALSMAFSLLFPRWQPVFFGLALGAGLYRILVGAHWLSDVIAGLGLGAGLGLVLAGACLSGRWLAVRAERSSVGRIKSR